MNESWEKGACTEWGIGGGRGSGRGGEDDVGGGAVALRRRAKSASVLDRRFRKAISAADVTRKSGGTSPPVPSVTTTWTRPEELAFTLATSGRTQTGKAGCRRQGAKPGGRPPGAWGFKMYGPAGQWCGGHS